MVEPRVISFKKFDPILEDPDVYFAEQIRSLNLLAVEYGYTSLRIKLLPRLQSTGTYRPRKRTVFCCELDKDYKGRDVVADDEYPLISEYVWQHTDEGKRNGCVAIYNLDKMEKVAVNEFKFREPSNKLDALIAILLLTDLKRVF